jgi:hypothetical protein
VSRITLKPRDRRGQGKPDRDLDAGRHLATVIVVHDSGRLYPQAIIFTTTAPQEVKNR